MHLCVFRPPLGHHQEEFSLSKSYKEWLIESSVTMLLIYVNRRSQRTRGLRCGVYGRSFTGIAGSNTIEGSNACLLRVLCVVR